MIFEGKYSDNVICNKLSSSQHNVCFKNSKTGKHC